MKYRVLQDPIPQGDKPWFRLERQDSYGGWRLVFSGFRDKVYEVVDTVKSTGLEATLVEEFEV